MAATLSPEDVLAVIRRYVRSLHSLARAAQLEDPEVDGFIEDVGAFAVDAYRALSALATTDDNVVDRDVTYARACMAAVAVTTAIALEPRSWPWPDTALPRHDLVESMQMLVADLWGRYQDVDRVLAVWSARRSG